MKLFPIALLTCVLAAAGPGLCGTPRTGAQERPSRPPDVPYDPTPRAVVEEMLRLAEVGAEDVVFDLGCGDGRIVVAAARRGARGVCVDIDPQRIAESRANAAREGVSGLITFRTEDLFATDLRGATVVMLFLWPEVNLRLRPRLLRELPAGTRVVSHMHDMGDWAPERSITVSAAGGSRQVYLWRIR